MVHPHADMFVAKYPCCHRGNVPCHCWIPAYLCRPVMEGDREQQRISNDMAIQCYVYTGVHPADSG